MILDTNEVDSRLSSPLNLINRMRNATSRAEIVSLPVEDKRQAPAQIVSLPSIDDIVDNVEDKINAGKAHSGARAVLAESIELLREQLPKVDSPRELSRIASDMGKLVNGFNNNKNEKQSNNSVIVYKPMFINEQSLEVVHVNE